MNRIAPWVMTVRRRLLFAIPMLLSVLLGCGRRPKSEQQQVVDLYIESDGDFLEFRPATLTCPTGALVRLTFHHAGKILTTRHDWVLTYPGQLEALTTDALKNDGIPARRSACSRSDSVVRQGRNSDNTFVAPRLGDYPFLCATHAEDTDAYNWEDTRPIGLTGSERENSPSFLNLSNRLSHVRSVPSQTIEIYGSIGGIWRW